MANDTPTSSGVPGATAPATVPTTEPPPAAAKPAEVSGSQVAAIEVHGHKKRQSLFALMLGALGVVFGDIGTSPLYTLRECVLHMQGDRAAGMSPLEAHAAMRSDVLDVLSLIFWSLMIVVTLKYLVFIMHADNKGEGGIMALLALVPKELRAAPLAPLSIVAILVVIGASFLYGDGAITPAISVLSAVEGIGVAKPELSKLVIPITVVLLTLLFGIQHRGTNLIGNLFGPIMIVWFVTIGGLGLYQIVLTPEVIEALSPHHVVLYFKHHGFLGFVVLGSVVLAVTGGEALYADMGHYGLRPIRRGWLFFVLPALVLSYFGQGALLIRDASALENPFFAMVPKGGATFALVILSSFATIIASQALISGSFSLTRQAMQMGLFPRVTIKHTAEEQEGQIYIPEVNYALAAVCIFLVLTFKSSSAMASVYGVAVTGTMSITSIVYFIVVWRGMNWPLKKALPLVLLFLCFDLPFVGANLMKIPAGGYVPLAIGGVVVAIMLVWHQGRLLVGRQYSTRYKRFDETWPELSAKIVTRTPGTVVFMASADQGIPPVLVHLVEHTRTLHQQVLLLTVVTKELPTVENKDRVAVTEIGYGFWRVHVFYGFMEQPDVPRALRLVWTRKLIEFDHDELTYCLARERILANPGGEMGVVLESFFAFLSRNAVNADRYFRIPPERVIEVGAQIDL